jgi:magnesium chelatase subunit D
VREYAGAEAELGARIERARRSLSATVVADAIYGAVGQLVVRSGVVSHRADVTILECAKALTALDGRPAVEADDVFESARLALGHRAPIDPFDANAGIDDRLLRRILDDVLDATVQEDEPRKKAAGPAGPG